MTSLYYGINRHIHREALTPSKDFIISPHSACEGLYVATCGSFHGFKFLPVLGKYVVEMLNDELEPALKERWAWDRELPPTAKNKHWPWKELRDLFNES
jgi:glycine/D-amino acid oxidase-like deaminating enzyme